MKLERKELSLHDRPALVKSWLEHDKKRLGLITSIDGQQLITLLLDTETKTAVLHETPMQSSFYHSLTPRLPVCHWQERICWDMFGLVPEGHPRLKPALYEPFAPDFFPLRKIPFSQEDLRRQGERTHRFMEVKGDGVYEIPVGPIHAGVIEPGHFRFSCLGEVILNLEIHLGYVHRGIEKRIVELPWTKARFACESAASDSVAAYALAHAMAMESLTGSEPTLKGLRLRYLALEIERAAMHIGDLIGFAADIGYLGVAASFSRLRGQALRLADLLSGNRFLRGFICPGGVAREPSAERLDAIVKTASALSAELRPVTEMLLENPAAQERMHNIGKVSNAIARNFGLVGVAGRASGIYYDARIWAPGISAFVPVLEKNGDVLSRAKVRVREAFASLSVIQDLASERSDDSHIASLPNALPPDAAGLGIAEGHRGELIHLAFTDESGKLCRYAMRDPSVNNWTALAIAIRNNLVADFPLCNKSFSLAYSGHDL